tara:strand:- start:62 stop:607 length:546 start_codon:yes stop_codon:yes gene_type:complete
MGCNHSKEKKPKYKRDDLTVIIPLQTRGEHIYTFQRPDKTGKPDIIIFKDGVVKKTFPDNTIGHKRFENEIAAYELMKNEYFIAEIFNIDKKNLSFSTYYTEKYRFDYSIINKSYRIYNILINNYGIEYNGNNPHSYIRFNNDLIFFQGLSKIPIKHKINDDWNYYPKENHKCNNKIFKNK